MATRTLEVRGNLESEYQDVFTDEAVGALEALAHFDKDRRQLLTARIERRNA